MRELESEFSLLQGRPVGGQGELRHSGLGPGRRLQDGGQGLAPVRRRVGRQVQGGRGLRRGQDRPVRAGLGTEGAAGGAVQQGRLQLQPRDHHRVPRQACGRLPDQEGLQGTVM